VSVVLAVGDSGLVKLRVFVDAPVGDSVVVSRVAEKLGAEVTSNGRGIEVDVSVALDVGNNGMVKLLVFVDIPVGD